MYKSRFVIGFCLLPLISGQALSEFGLSFMKQLCEEENCVFSPYSIYNILGMLLMAAGGESETQLMQAMKLDGQSNNAALHKWIGDAKAQLLNANLNDEVVINLADNIYVNQGLTVDPSYQASLKTYYDVAGPRTVNFGDSVKAAQLINGFVSNATKGEITDLFSSSSFSAATLAVLVNAIYLKADWEMPFDAIETRDADFFISRDLVVDVKMMELEHEFRYQIDAEKAIFEMPYKNPDLAMYVVVPKDNFRLIRDNIKSVVDLLADLGSQDVQKLKVKMPKFNFKDRTDLKLILQKLGVTDVFMEGVADLSKMSPDLSPFISAAIHEAKIYVDELGTIASAATGVAIVAESIKIEPQIITVDRPFVYMIVYKPTTSLLFMGQVINPTLEE